MKENYKNDYFMSPEKFGPLWKYVIDDSVTDIEWDAGRLWIQRINEVRAEVFEPELTDRYMEDFALRVGIINKSNFNAIDNVIMANTTMLRIVCLHPSLALSGVTVCIRKSLPQLRFDMDAAIKQGYCDEKLMQFLIHSVRANQNFVFCGDPGSGKTEAVKFFSSYIEKHKKVITIEDVCELHYQEINPQSSCVEMKVKSHDEYEKALAVSLRLNPTRLILSEMRGREVRFLLEAWSNGVSVMSTMHTRKVSSIPERVMNMMGNAHCNEQVENQIYENIGIGVMLKKEKIGAKDTRHYITEVAIFCREHGENRINYIFQDGRFYEERIPSYYQEYYGDDNCDEEK